MTPDRTNALAALRRSPLVRDDSGPTRVYRDATGAIFHSVTSILSATKDSSGLENWAAGMDRIYGPGAAIQERTTAATRGNQTHSSAEYLLKTALRVARATANKRRCLTVDPYGLPHIPTAIWHWSVERTLPRVPSASFSASGYRRCLLAWIVENVTQCHACEFSVSYPCGVLDSGGAFIPGVTSCLRGVDTVGFAGTADALVSLSGSFLAEHGLDPALAGAPFIADWKTSANKRSDAMLHDYRLQCGAYSLGLERLTGVVPAGACIVVARRAGPPQLEVLDRRSLTLAQQGYLERATQFFASCARSNTEGHS